MGVRHGIVLFAGINSDEFNADNRWNFGFWAPFGEINMHRECSRHSLTQIFLWAFLQRTHMVLTRWTNGMGEIRLAQKESRWNSLKSFFLLFHERLCENKKKQLGCTHTETWAKIKQHTARETTRNFDQIYFGHSQQIGRSKKKLARLNRFGEI